VGKAQALVISSFVLVMVLIVAISLFLNYFDTQADEAAYEEVLRESAAVSSMLAGEGYPVDWESDTVKRAGLVRNDCVSNLTLADFGRIAYSRTKLLLGTQDDYLYYFEKKDGEPYRVGVREFWGWNGYEEPNGGRDLQEALDHILAHSSTLAKHEEFVVLCPGDQRIPVTLVTYVWQFAQSAQPLDSFNGLDQGFYQFSGGLYASQLRFSTGDEVRLSR